MHVGRGKGKTYDLRGPPQTGSMSVVVSVVVVRLRGGKVVLEKKGVERNCMCSWVLQTVCCAKKGCFSNRLNQGKCTKDGKVSGFGLIWKKTAQHSQSGGSNGGPGSCLVPELAVSSINFKV